MIRVSLRRRGRPREREEDVVARLEHISALVYALLHDLAAWLSRTDGPVDRRLYPEYRIPQGADLPTPALRMARYMNPAILDEWEPVIEEWLASGRRYRPSFGRNLRLAVTEGDPGGARAEVTFRDRSEIEMPGQGRASPGGVWTLAVGLTPDSKQVATATLRPSPQ